MHVKTYYELVPVVYFDLASVWVWHQLDLVDLQLYYLGSYQ